MFLGGFLEVVDLLWEFFYFLFCYLCVLVLLGLVVFCGVFLVGFFGVGKI